ncbi:MAG: T9SS type A sorting domain-containing protein, partial [Ignavibacteriota bacterium]
MCTLLISNVVFSQTAWVTQSSGTTSSVNAVYFINNETGFCAGNGGLLLKTTNSGLQWNQITSPVAFNFDYLKFFGNDSAVLAANNIDSIYFTTNAGANWYLRDVNTPYYSSYRQIEFVNFNVGYYLSGGHLYRTTNNGISWTDYYTTIGIKHISFPDELTGWEAGTYTLPYPPPYGTNYAEIRKTTNGGINWSVQISTQENSYSIYRVFFRNINTGFYNDFSSWSIRKTVNGGTNYLSVTNGGSYKNYYAMHFPSNNTGWLIGDQIIKTTDGGSNFVTITNTPNPVNSYKGVFFINDNTGWLVGLNGTIIKTQTGGITNIIKVGSITKEYNLEQNYPNPFNPATKIKFDVTKFSSVRIIVYDVSGREIQTLVNDKLLPGTYEITFDGSILTSGVYFYKMTIE